MNITHFNLFILKGGKDPITNSKNCGENEWFYQGDNDGDWQ